MNTIKQRAHEYAQERYMKNGTSLMRAYAAGAYDERRIQQNKRVKVFLSGHVSGLEYLVAYGKFSNEERLYSALGYKVINPMKICKKHWSWVRCMIKCLWAIIFCHKIHQLPGWQESRGARIEYRWAKFLGKEVI